MAGFMTRQMPPIDWYCGDIPEELYKAESLRDAQYILFKEYLKEENINRLVNYFKDSGQEVRDGFTLETLAKIQLEIMAEIDAETLYWSKYV